MTHRDDAGNVQVDFVWGNFPMQPDDDRTDQGFSFGGGSGDRGWNSTYYATSDNLRIADYYNDNSVQGLFDLVVPTDHVRASLGYSNFPGYIPNYAGDEDSGLETVVPNVLRMNIGDAQDALDKANLNYRIQRHNPSVFYLQSSGTTVRVYAYDENAGGAGGPEAYLVGLKVGDKVYPDNNEYSFDGPVTVTKVNEDGESSWFEFETAEAVNVDTSCNGTVWPDNTLVNLITIMRYWNQPGDIKDEGTNIYLRAFGD